MVLLIALLAGGSLWALRQLQTQQVRLEATRSVIDQGRLLAASLAADPLVRKPRLAEIDWQAFSRQIRSMRTLEPGLQYVSVVKEGVTVFNEQLSGLDIMGQPVQSGAEQAGAGALENLRVDRRILQAGNRSVPVVVFSADFKGDDGTLRTIEIALRKEAVEREQQATAGAVSSMFKVSLVTVVVSFGICAILVVWMMHRETLREKHRREEEHLAFAGVLANGIVHDFRNPMSSLRLDVQMLAKEAQAGEKCRIDRLAQLATRIRSTLDRMDKVFQEFLYMSKPMPNRLETVDLAVCVKDCVAVLEARHEHAGLQMTVQYPPHPVPVAAFPSALQRAVMNVLVNAEQFSPAGGRIEVEVSLIDGMGVVDVRDQGPGIPQEDRKRVFEMFVSTRPGGTGLGLFLARTAVEKCGGSLRVLDKTTPGAWLRLSLPLASQGAGTPA